MPNQVVGSIPDFSSDTTLAPPIEGEEQAEVKEPEAEEAPVVETETPASPPEEINAPETAPVAPSGQDSAGPPDELKGAIQALQGERAKLLKDISELRGQRRELKREELIKVNERIDELKDVNPQDVGLIEKVLRAKGYVTKDEAHGMFYEAVKQEELNKFLERYPEYKPENDSGDVNWSTLQRELGYYRMPDDPHAINDILERAHRNIANLSRTFADRAAPVKARQAELAGAGAGGAQRSSPRHGTLEPRHRAVLEAGGWSSEEIANIEKKLG